MGLVLLKDLLPKRRVSESWKEEGPTKKVKIPAGVKFLEVVEDLGDQRAAWKQMSGHI